MKLSLLVTIVFFVTVSFVTFLVDNPTHDGDLLVYFYHGIEILYGDRTNVQTFNAPAGWPIILASSDFLINDPFITAKIFSVTFSTGIVFISYFIIRNFFDKKVALLGQIIIAVNPLLHVESIITHSEMLPVFLIFIFFYFITKENLQQKHIIFCAIFLGLSFMIRPQSLFLGFGVLIFILFFVKKQKKQLIFYFILFFVLTISPLIIYNLSTSGNVIDNDPNFYLSMESVSNKEVFKTIISNQNSEISYLDKIKNNIQFYFQEYPENLFLYNSHVVFNLGLGYNNFSTIPFLSFNGLFFVFGGILGFFRYEFPKKYLIGILGFSITLFTLLILTNQIEKYFFLPLILPLIIIGTLSIKKIPDNVLRLLVIGSFFMLFISIIRIQAAWDMFAILIIPTAFSAFFVIKIIPKIIIKIQNILKIEPYRGIKFSLVIIILIIITSNLISSYMVEKNILFEEPVDYHNLLSSEKNYDLVALRYIEIGEILSMEPDIENKIVMASSNNYAHYAKSKFLFTYFNEGLEEDTIDSFISRTNWSDYQIRESNMWSIPPDRHNRVQHVPDYLVYDNSPQSIEKFQIFKNPKHPEIPNNFELIYVSNKTGTVLYKIEH